MKVLMIILVSSLLGTLHAATEQENRINFLGAVKTAEDAAMTLKLMGDVPRDDETREYLSKEFLGASKQADKVDPDFLGHIHPGLKKSFEVFSIGHMVFSFGLRSKNKELTTDGLTMVNGWYAFWKENKGQVLAKLDSESHPLVIDRETAIHLMWGGVAIAMGVAGFLVGSRALRKRGFSAQAIHVNATPSVS